jgi:hypothetical protein
VPICCAWRAAKAGRNLSEFRTPLAEDIDEILLVRVPQFPSSRAWGDWPGGIERRIPGAFAEGSGAAKDHSRCRRGLFRLNCAIR